MTNPHRIGSLGLACSSRKRLMLLRFLIRNRIGFAPAVRADIALHDLAGTRRDEQRAGRAHLNALGAILVLSLLFRELVAACAEKPYREAYSAGNANKG
jgi:hypothetical protein